MNTPWSVPTETKPAPGSLLLVQAFVNTWDGEQGTDELLDPGSACDWLSRAGLWAGPGSPTPGELHLARSAREGIRALLIANSGGPAPTADDLRFLHALADAAHVQMAIQPNGQISLTAAHDGQIEGQLARILLIIRDAQRDGTWTRLKACRNPECRWAFYDRSHSQRGTWCDMAVCGNRIKNRRLRQRRA